MPLYTVRRDIGTGVVTRQWTVLATRYRLQSRRIPKGHSLRPPIDRVSCQCYARQVTGTTEDCLKLIEWKEIPVIPSPPRLEISANPDSPQLRAVGGRGISSRRMH